MYSRTVWLRCFAREKSFEEEIRAAMVRSGFQVASNMDGPYGIVCYDSIDELLLAQLREVRGDRCRVLAFAVSSHAYDSATVWRLLHAGASDVLQWDSNGSAAFQLAAKLQRWHEVDELAAAAVSQESLVGQSPSWQSVIRKIVEAARFSAMPVLLTGESGTGKEMLAKLFSTVCAAEGGARRFRKELVTVDCASLVPELSGSEFFGHERGAFTGAHVQREGAFALADGATLLLDEIGEVPPVLQAQLLRAIQEKTYKRVGGNVWHSTNFRLVCATNRNLEDLVQQGKFRLDLYYRIAGCVFRTPTLAERKEDILPLAKHFLASALSGEAPVVDSAVSEYLLNREYNGNVRELRQLSERIALRHVATGPIGAGDIPEEDRPREGKVAPIWPDEELERSVANALATGVSLKEITQAAAETAIRIAVRSEGSNLQRAAGRLGITDRALQIRRATGRLRDQAM